MFAILLLALLGVTKVRGTACNDDNGNSGTKVVYSELICENCKCNNFKGRRHGEPVADRAECEQKAAGAGQEYYNYLVDGPTTRICVFEKDDSKTGAASKTSEESCVSGRTMTGGVPLREDDDGKLGTKGKRDIDRDITDGITKSHWKVFKITTECRLDTCTNVVHAKQDGSDGYKCRGLDHVQFRPNPYTAVDVDQCALEAHTAGFNFFSYRTDKKFCYYGAHTSSPLRCTTGKVKTKNQAWAIYTVDCSQSS
jgi:hypothetical protein